MDWSAGYVTEIGYTHGYYRELSPQYLALGALARGIRAPGLGSMPLRILELGCGQGFSANIIAAANPHIHYTAVDFNPAHIAGAQTLAANAGIGNVVFREASFEEIAQDTGEPFDIIALHGIYSWVSPENRAHIVNIIRNRLKTGGFIYLSYNCFPGWTPILPIRRMMRDAGGAHSAAPMAERLDEAFRFFDQMKELGARYLTTAGVADRVDKFRSMPRNYLAHEFMNADWTIFHFADIAAEMSTAKLSFACSAHLLDLLDVLNLSPEQVTFLSAIKDSVRREALRDLIINQQFRRDIFGRGMLPLSQNETRALWLDQRFALSLEAGKIPRKTSSARGELKLQADIYDPLIAKLDGGPKTLRELVAEPAIAAIGWLRLLQAILILVGQGNCHPALPGAGEGERTKRTDAFNAAVLARARDSAELTHLASPVTGSGILVDRLVQLYLLAAREKAADRYSFVWDVLKAQGQKIVKDGKTLEADAENLEEITTRLKAFEAGQARVLAQLKVR